MYILHNDIKYYSEIPKVMVPYYPKLSKSKDILSLDFFNNWLVGFTIAEGSFLKNSNQDMCFQLSQRLEPLLFEAIKLKFDSNVKIGVDKNKKYSRLSFSNKKDIQKVINFFSFSGNHPLLGLKLIKYENWLKVLQKSKRYCNLIFPI